MNEIQNTYVILLVTGDLIIAERKQSGNIVDVELVFSNPFEVLADDIFPYKNGIFKDCIDSTFTLKEQHIVFMKPLVDFPELLKIYNKKRRM